MPFLSGPSVHLSLHSTSLAHLPLKRTCSPLPWGFPQAALGLEAGATGLAHPFPGREDSWQAEGSRGFWGTDGRGCPWAGCTGVGNGLALRVLGKDEPLRAAARKGARGLRVDGPPGG